MKSNATSSPANSLPAADSDTLPMRCSQSWAVSPRSVRSARSRMTGRAVCTRRGVVVGARWRVADVRARHQGSDAA
jgi:hypothetical protein